MAGERDLIVIEIRNINRKESVIELIRRFYRENEDKNLEYLDKLIMKLRLYSIHEVKYMAEQAGWKYIKAYRSIATLEPFGPSLSNPNIVL